MPTSNRLSFWTCAAVLALALWTSGAATPVYPLYSSDWHLTPFLTTAIFAVYPLVLVVVLLVFGDLSDTIGRRASILLGVLSSIVGVLLFALAPDVVWLLVGRAFMGLGVGLSLSPATAKMIDVAGSANAARTGAISTASTAVGLVFASLLGGALVQYAPFPLHLTYWVLLGVEVIVLVLVFRLDRDRPADAGRWRPHGIVVPRYLWGAVATAAISLSASYAIGAVVLSLGASIGKQLTHTSNAFVIGAIIALSMVVIGVVALASRKVPLLAALPVAFVAAVLSFGSLILAASLQSLGFFLAFTIFAGIAYSLLFAGGLQIIGRFTPEHHRAGTLSAGYLVAYLVQGAAALWLGSEATAGGYGHAVDLGAPAIVALVLVALVAGVVLLRPRAPRRPRIESVLTTETHEVMTID
ncbi:MFS transporter [Frondihabitans australicus]|uniref:Putative MFS family arabinose efflux permease n=1 Tax=Frondihabitans australicus TaxID=386892 RepID=A0A495IH08_9MICO|nr:MFS transporter [Frondihabitans australicus]RKR74435.1 putative MFS family arabinose efflux permease [Frondihabitans australicus]